MPDKKDGKQKSFKVGDRVFATRNRCWGTQEMKVTKVIREGCNCLHPGSLGEGHFLNYEIEHVTKKRRQALERWLDLLSVARKLEEALFQS